MTSTSTGPLQPLLRNSCTSGPCHGLDLLASVGALWHLSQSPRVQRLLEVGAVPFVYT